MRTASIVTGGGTTREIQLNFLELLVLSQTNEQLLTLLTGLEETDETVVVPVEVLTDVSVFITKIIGLELLDLNDTKLELYTPSPVVTPS